MIGHYLFATSIREYSKPDCVIFPSQYTSMVDWSNLPYDLIALIANKLYAVEDFLAFSAVCSSWRLVYLKKNWNPSATSPWLILDVNHNSEALIRCNLSLCRSKASN